MTREVAKREIESLDYYLQNHTNDYSEESHTAMVMAIKALEQEPKTGHWMIVYRKSIYTHLVCDKCLSNAHYDCRTNYCPNCGAKMVETQERSEKE